MILSNPRERRRFLRFLVVGVIGTVVDFGSMNLLKSLAHASLVLAGTLSFLAGVTSNFLWNRYWTYPDSRSKPVHRQFVEFAVINALGLAIRVPILAFAGPPLRVLVADLAPYLPPLLAGLSSITIADNLTLALAVGIVLFWNFFANRYWTYADVE